jgi:hypothetical protein
MILRARSKIFGREGVRVRNSSEISLMVALPVTSVSAFGVRARNPEQRGCAITGNGLRRPALRYPWRAYLPPPYRS